MDAHAVGQFQFFEVGQRVEGLAAIVEGHGQFLVVGVGGGDIANVAVEHAQTVFHAARPAHVVVVLDLHDLVALAEDHLAAAQLALAGGGRVDGLLQHGVEGVNARVHALHRRHHLYAAQGIDAQIARQARGDQLHHGIDRRAHALLALEEKVRVPRAHLGIFSAVDAMGVAHDHARGGLAEDLGERHRGHRAAFEHVL